jgi:hypothetical protein
LRRTLKEIKSLLNADQGSRVASSKQDCSLSRLTGIRACASPGVARRYSTGHETDCRSSSAVCKGLYGSRRNSPQPFFLQLSQVGAGRVNRVAPRGLSQYADDMRQFSFFFAITQPDVRRRLRLTSCPALQPIRAGRARYARHRTGWGWELPSRSSANHRCRRV